MSFSNKNISGIAFAVIVLAFLGYGLNFIERTSFEIDGEKTYALFDDAMISMQYAKNNADGFGLVWNAGGERVEGYSNTLWVMIMTLVHLFPIPLTLTSYVVKLISLVFLILNLFAVFLIARELTKSRLIPLLSVFLTAFYYPLNNWSLHGMEVGLMALLINVAVLIAIRALAARRLAPELYLMTSLAIFLRMDAFVVVVLIALGMAWIDSANRKNHLQLGLGTIFLTLLVLTIFRLAYYGEWLPNTAHLKLGDISTPLRITLGAKVWWDFIWNSNWLLFFIPLSLLFIRRKNDIFLLFALVLAQMAYSIFVGGDSWEHVGGANRFIAAVMPLFFILFTLTLNELSKLVIASSVWPQDATKILSSFALVMITAISLLSFNTLTINDYFKVWTLGKKPIFTSGAERYVRMGLMLKNVSTSNAVIAVTTAGTIPYFSERISLDLMGKADLVVARGEARINSSLFHPGNFRPGHNKWDYAYSVGELSPDVIAQFWQNTEEDLAPYLDPYVQIQLNGIPYYFRLDSPNLNWDLIHQLSN